MEVIQCIKSAKGISLMSDIKIQPNYCCILNLINEKLVLKFLHSKKVFEKFVLQFFSTFDD